MIQHKDNPVDWYPWGAEAFAAAKREDKPVFLSIGYSTCHWCHVMAHESFEDPAVAEILRDFICIKVDREERPDIDAVYMDVCQALTGSGGWPLTVLMTPEQKPFFAGTYFPKRSRYGRPGLMDLLRQVKNLWDSQRPQLLKAGDDITQILQTRQKSGTGTPGKAVLERAYGLFRQSFDPGFGGFGLAPKFPAPHNLMFLLRYAASEKAPGALAMVEKTLDAMARGGIFDQIGGGFSRYSTDEKWLVPHFEKMLYDNALLIPVYLEAYQRTGNASYADIARRTADYILEELTGPQGCFYCGQDADSDGEEGKYYTFTPEEVKAVLGQEKGNEFCRLYGISDRGNFEEKSIPNRIGQKEAPWQPPELEKLYAYRKKRAFLHKDDKVLLSWNAWAMIAMAQAGFILEEHRYLQAAVAAQRFIEEKMTDGRNRLYHRYRDGDAAHVGQLDDYAVYALALLELYRRTLDAAYLKQAIFRAEQMVELFEDQENGGYFLGAHDAERLIARPKEVYDGAIPSGNAVAAMVLGQIGALGADSVWQERADRQLCFLTGQIRDYPAGHAFSLLAVANSLYRHRELICAGKKIPAELMDYLRTHPAQDVGLIFKSGENKELLAQILPFTWDYPVPEAGVRYYLCENGTCRAPVDDFKELSLE